jgi:hypothetical protein
MFYGDDVKRPPMIELAGDCRTLTGKGFSPPQATPLQRQW